METTSSKRAAGMPARDLRWGRGLRVAVLTVGLAWAPVLARDAVAQRSGTIQATASVIDSQFAAAFRSDSADAAVRTPPRTGTERIRIAGLGVLEVQSGPGAQVRVASRVEEPRSRSLLVVQVSISCVGS
jgi:hypothetical protein